MRTADFSRVAKETLVSSFGPRPLQLLTDDPAGGQIRPLALLPEPFGEFRRKTNAYCVTHTAKVYYKRRLESRQEHWLVASGQLSVVSCQSDRDEGFHALRGHKIVAGGNAPGTRKA